MASFWFWLIAVVVALLGASILSALLFLLLTWMYDIIKIKRKIPKKENIGEYVKINKEFFKDGGKNQSSKKEVEEDERRSYEKFREYEKLRRIGVTQGGVSGKGKSTNSIQRIAESERRSILQNEPSPEPTAVKRKLKLGD